MNRVPRPGSLSTETLPPIPSAQLLDDREAEPRADLALAPVALVQVEALERVRELLGAQPGPRVLHRDLARARGHAYASARGRDPQRVLDQVPEQLQHAIRIAGRGSCSVDPGLQLDFEPPRGRFVPSHRFRRRRREVDRPGMHAEFALVHPREIEQVADQPLEPPGLLRDRLGRLLDADRAVAQRLVVAADRRQRCLQLVRDRQEELALGGPRPLELDGRVVERLRQRAQLRRALNRQRLGHLAARELSRRGSHPPHRLRDPASQEERNRRSECHPDEPADQERFDVGRVRAAGASRPDQDERLLPDRIRRIEVRRTGDVDAAAGRQAVPQPLHPELRYVRRPLLEVHDQRLLFLEGQAVLEAPHEDGQRRDASLRLLADQIRLEGECTQRRPVDRAPRQHRADRERDPDRQDDDEHDRGEEPRAERVHSRTALYPDPRIVRMSSGRPSLRRSCATCTSTVRVPPAYVIPHT